MLAQPNGHLLHLMIETARLGMEGHIYSVEPVLSQDSFPESIVAVKDHGFLPVPRNLQKQREYHPRVFKVKIYCVQGLG